LKGIDYLTESKKTKYQWTNFALYKNENRDWVGQDEQLIITDGTNRKYSEFEDIKSIDEKANRMLFIRISSYQTDECKKNNGPEEELKGEAVFVFYDNDNEIKGHDSIHDTRFVHVLRNEISKYLREKYNKDAFKAWVKEKRKNEYMLSLNHGIDRYKNIMDKSIDNIKKTLSDPDFEQTKDDAKFSKSFLTNKFNLLSIISLIESKNDYNAWQFHYLKDLINEFESKYLFILSYKGGSRIRDKRFINENFKHNILSEELDTNVSHHLIN
jgi:hypothetical protein